MFKNKYLKQLQDVQCRIKHCQRDLQKLEPPVPDSLKVEQDMLRWFQLLFSGCHPDLQFMLDKTFSGPDNKTRSYASELGFYFLHITRYYKEKQQLEKYLNGLQNEERRLKEKLGID